jgi:uncharacterized DUF497 family protein
VVLFQWDPKKSESNFRKHGVLFEEAIEVFSDPQAIDLFDMAHSQLEDRFLLVGCSRANRLLLIVYSLRRSSVEKEDYGRIISARIANKEEQKLYGQRGR